MSPIGEMSASEERECECREKSWQWAFVGWQLAFDSRRLAVGGLENALVGSWLVAYVMGPSPIT